MHENCTKPIWHCQSLHLNWGVIEVCHLYGRPFFEFSTRWLGWTFGPVIFQVESYSIGPSIVNSLTPLKARYPLPLEVKL